MEETKGQTLYKELLRQFQYEIDCAKMNMEHAALKYMETKDDVQEQNYQRHKAQLAMAERSREILVKQAVVLCNLN